MSQMPKIEIERIATEAGRKFAALITTNRGGVNVLRASKPKVEKIKVPDDRYGYHYEPADPDAGRAAYIWRMVAFQISTNHRHHCMPCTADFDLPGTCAESRAEAKALDDVVASIVDSVPKEQWHGVLRWGRAYGII